MSQKQQSLFSIGREVSYALPLLASPLSPSIRDLQAAARKLGITTKKARVALNYFLYN